jgi:hypothetical protein
MAVAIKVTGKSVFLLSGISCLHQSLRGEYLGCYKNNESPRHQIQSLLASAPITHWAQCLRRLSNIVVGCKNLSLRRLHSV